MSQKNKEPNSNSAKTQYELASLYFQKAEFNKALDCFQSAAQQFFESQDISNFLLSAQKILRIYAEKEDYKSIDCYKSWLQDLAVQKQITLDAKTYYVLALCAFYKKDIDKALEYTEKSLALALKANNKEDICYAIHGISIIYTSMGRFDEALKEIYNLRVFFQIIDNVELQIQSDMMCAHILLRIKQFDEALDLLWTCYDRLKKEKNFLLHIELLYTMGLTYSRMGQVDVAKIYLNLASQSIDPENLKNLKKAIDKVMLEIGQVKESEYDLIFDSTKNTIMEKKIGRVNFHNQFILLDLLKLFLRKPGEVHSKEEIVKKVWKQSYDPGMHDNKLYVTIKRLRKMIEPEYEKPRYIFRAKNGYYLNKDVKVLMQKK